MIKEVITAFIFFICLNSVGNAEDYHFQLIKTVEFPVSNTTPYNNYLIDDLNGDGIDELFVFYPGRYYIYSFNTDTICYSDTTFDCYGAVLGDYDSDDIKDVILCKRSDIYVLDGRLDREVIDLDASIGFKAYNRHIDAYYGDPDKNGLKDLIFGANSQGSWYYGGGFAESFICGNLQSIQVDGWLENWEEIYKIGDVMFGGKIRIAAERTLFVDIDDDSIIELIPSGYRYYAETYLGSTYENSYYDLDILNHNGIHLWNRTSSNRKFVIAGKLDVTTPGNELIVFSNQFFTMYDIINNSVEEIWKSPAVEFEGKYYGSLFYLPGIPGTFCTGASGKDYQIYSAQDGTKVGGMFGLKPGLETIEGTFYNVGDLEVIQIEGNKAYVYRLDYNTDANDEMKSEDIQYNLTQNYPNPFNASTRIDYFVPRSNWVTITVYNILGSRVNTIVDSYHHSGQHNVVWDGKDETKADVSSGIYFYHIKSSEYSSCRKMILLK